MIWLSIVCLSFFALIIGTEDTASGPPALVVAVKIVLLTMLGIPIGVLISFL